MKLRNIILGIGALGLLTACSDYLDVDAPSKNLPDKVYSSTGEMDKALNGVYSTILTGNTFGNALYNGCMLNSDVDFASNSNEQAQNNQPRRFDMNTNAGYAETLWNSLYSIVETANTFVYNAEHSDLYNEANEDYADVTQMVGEAKVIRAMALYELVCYYGDVPFTFEPTYQSENFFPDIVSRDTIYQTVINDLIEAAPKMKSVTALSEGVERISKEACQAMIARLALQAGGYSLRPDDNNSYGTMQRPANYREFYKIARDYADSVIVSGTHSLSNSYKDVFVNECNFRVVNNDDPIFEIPFAQGNSGGWGYYQGPQVASSNGEAPYVYGEENGGVRSEAFYRYTFDTLDVRRDYVNGLIYYANTGAPAMRSAYNVHNNKWAKLWNTNGLGANTTGSTGINFAYLRYADVLLMFAEADNELNGPTAAAQEALKTVRRRAFNSANYADKVETYVANAASSKESFLKAVLDERKWEFAGENSRWKDLVRNNIYGKTLFDTFMRYYVAAENAMSSSAYTDMVEANDGIEWSSFLPYEIYWTYIQNPGDGSLFTNTSVPIIYMVNPYKTGSQPQVKPDTYFTNNNLPYTAITAQSITGLQNSDKEIQWYSTNFYDWWNDGAGVPKNEVLYSLYGYIRGSESGTISIVRNGVAQAIDPLSVDRDNLPAVRYLFPIPQEAVARSGNRYQQHYGY